MNILNPLRHLIILTYISDRSTDKPHKKKLHLYAKNVNFIDLRYEFTVKCSKGYLTSAKLS